MRQRWELALLLGLAAALQLTDLGVNGTANEYYSAAVRAMSESWSAFLFNAFDPSLVMTVDKPPLALWVQALFARVLGYGDVAMLVPQALCTIGSVALVYDLVRRRFGRAAGFAGGLVLALTPLSVAMGRHNNPDALLILCCVAALWFLARALEDGRTRWVVWCGVMVGLGFETKMLAAFLVVPALAVALLWVWRRAAIRPLLLGGAAMAAVGLAWPVLMWLVPAGSRPWISGTADNSIWSLILGYNGIGRVGGQAGGPQGGGGFGGGSVFGGDAGPFRLLQESLGGQAGWFLGFAVVAAIALLVAARDRQARGWAIAVGGCFATCAVAFSLAQGIFHPYYVAQLAPFTAALVGAGVGRLSRWPAVAALAAAAVAQIVIVRQDAGDLAWTIPIVCAVCAGAAAVLLLERRLRVVALGVAVAALLAAPASWAFQTVGHATGTTFPSGGPATSSFAPFGGDDLSSVVAYVDANGGGTIGVASQSTAASAIIADGADVAGLGGFSGRESQVSAEWLAERDIRWIYTAAERRGGPSDGRVGSSAVFAAVEQACATTGVEGLYDCAGAAGAIAASG